MTPSSTGNYHRISTHVYLMLYSFFFFNDTATTEIYTLSLHDALPISWLWLGSNPARLSRTAAAAISGAVRSGGIAVASVSLRSEEHTSELQSQSNLVCRLLLEKKKKQNTK